MTQQRPDGERLAVLESRVDQFEDQLEKVESHLGARLDRLFAAQGTMAATMERQHGELWSAVSGVREDVSAMRATMDSWRPPRDSGPRDWATKGGVGAALITVAGGVAYAVLQMVAQGG